MNIVLTPFLAAWIALACAVAILAIYRKTISSHEDDSLHVSAVDDVNVSHQAEVAHRLEIVDRWGKLLTIIVAVYGVALAAAYTYQMWVEGSRTLWKG
jgi:cell division protein FtsI/penicillin-binding protein 2